MQLESAIILKLFLNFCDSEPQYSSKFVLMRKRVQFFLGNEALLNSLCLSSDLDYPIFASLVLFLIYLTVLASYLICI